MITVIADDLTGAAELAGIALQFGISTEIKCEYEGTTTAKLLVLNTSSRLLDQKQAYYRVKEAAEYALSQNPAWIYKKTDSVLRGNVLAEISAVLNTTQQRIGLLIPANPGLGRTIINTKYKIQNKVLTETSFANDPDYPAKSADVLQLLGEFSKTKTGYIKYKQSLPDNGVFIGEVKKKEDLEYWATKVEKSILPAGAAEFFTELLLKFGYTISKETNNDIPDYGKLLFICGSTHQNSKNAITRAVKNGASISLLPEKLLLSPDSHSLKEWYKEIVMKLKSSNKLIITVNSEKALNMDIANHIQKTFGEVVERLISEKIVNTLVIEGGETAQTITEQLNINSFIPLKLLSEGVIELSTGQNIPSIIILKPGSYLWPDALWHFN